MASSLQIGVLVVLVLTLQAVFADALGVSSHHVRSLRGPGELRDSYDYVIIGAGTAGLTLGDRLSEDEETTVLVIESGADVNADWINDVHAADDLTWDPDTSWLHLFDSAPNKELNNQSTLIFVGNVVGGSSAVNGMQAPRGTKEDYNRWGSFFGPESSWTWDGMLPYFKKATYFQKPSETALSYMPGYKSDPSYWGTEKSTKVYTGWPTFQWPGVKYQIEALSQVPGVEFPEDAGAGEAGVYWYPTFMDGDASVNRSYARTGHWVGINRPNYHLLTNNWVTKIDLEGNKARGVIFRASNDTGTDPELTTIKADKEVILSAGTYHSPQILQLSGIGPRKLLESAGIETKVHLPGVGQNFHDHTTLYLYYSYGNFTMRPNRRDDFVDQNPEFLAWADKLWATNRTGPWSKGLFNIGAWLPLTAMAPGEYESLASAVEAQNAADMHPEGSEADPTVLAGQQARLQAMATAIRSPNTIFYQQGFSGDEPNIYITYEHPLSAGTVNINVSDPSGPPVADWRTYSNPVDFDIMLAMARFHRKLNLESPVYLPFEPVETAPGLNVTSREDWIEYMRGATLPSAMHPTGTCAMMPLELGGVVDEQLKVYGVEGLRVVDASVMSVLVGVNLCQSVYAIAEKAADHIKGIIH